MMGKPLQQPLGDLTKEEFNQLIYLFLDGEASEDEIAYLESKCNSCEHSAAFYDSECSFYKMLKTNLNKTAAPRDLIEQIRNGIKSHTPLA